MIKKNTASQPELALQQRAPEIWKTVPGYDAYYEVSNRGRVRSYKNHNDGRRSLPKVLKAYQNSYGYVKVKLSIGTSEQDMAVHRLVAELFLPNPDNKPQVNHIDGDKANNCVTNLEWCTHSENVKHAYDHGIMVAPSGEEHPMAKLSEGDVMDIRRVAKKRGKYYGRAALAKKYGVSEGAIKCIVSRKTWSHV